MREIIAEQAARANHTDAPAAVHDMALAVLAAVALGVLVLVMAVDRVRKRRR